MKSSLLMQGMRTSRLHYRASTKSSIYRDTSCWVYGGVSINPMAKPARQRETNHVRAIYRWRGRRPKTSLNTSVMKKSTTTTQRLKVVTFLCSDGAVRLGMSEQPVHSALKGVGRL